MKALQKHIDEDFTQQSGIEVEVDTLPLETMRTVLQTQLRSGEGPDVFAWGSGPSFGGALAKAGLVMDLTKAYEDNDWQVYDFAKQRVTFDGKVYGLPGEAETIGLYYNKDIFSKLGLDQPKSLADVEAASQAARKAGLTPLAVGDKEGWEGGHLLSIALSSAGRLRRHAGPARRRRSPGTRPRSSRRSSCGRSGTGPATCPSRPRRSTTTPRRRCSTRARPR